MAATNGGRVTASVNQLKDGTGGDASLIDVTDDSQQMLSPTLIFLCFFTTDSAFQPMGVAANQIFAGLVGLKIIELPGGQINDPSLGKRYSL